jgi:hypothetical protein
MRSSGARRDARSISFEPSSLSWEFVPSPSEMLCPIDGDLLSDVERALNRGKSPVVE